MKTLNNATLFFTSKNVWINMILGVGFFYLFTDILTAIILQLVWTAIVLAGSLWVYNQLDITLDRKTIKEGDRLALEGVKNGLNFLRNKATNLVAG